jgi:tetratricopeptide (TPR) repeat protein
LALLNIAAFALSPSGPLLTEAAEAARQALGLEPETADAYAALAVYAHRFHWNWAEAQRLFQRALALAPKSVHGHASFGHALVARGRFAEGEQHVRYARQLDPLNVGLRASYAQMLYYARRHTESEAELTGLLEIAPKHAFAEYVSGVNALYSGRAEVARDAFKRATASFPDHPSPRLLVTAALALEGRHREARDHLARLLANLGQRYFCRYHLAIAYAYLGDREAMYSALDDAAAMRDVLLVSLPVEPAFDAYHVDARFRTFLDAHRLASIEESRPCTPPVG